MIIGVPREIKQDEYRVALLPFGAEELTKAGHRVLIERGAGTGSGIPHELLNRVFDPFFTTKGPDQGEGLGLYIVRQIVTRYDGAITVDNVDAGGTRFEIRFPATGGPTGEEE